MGQEGSCNWRLDQLAHDTRFALRQFRRAPGLTFAALLALTLGIGGMATVFTLIDAVVLRPLPVPAPANWSGCGIRHSPTRYSSRWRSRAHAHRCVRMGAADAPGRVDERARADVDGARDGRIPQHARPSAGRGPLAQHADVGNSAAEAQAVAVLSYAAWQRRFGGDREAIGRWFRIEGQPFTIVGVTPPDFFGVAVGMSPEVTIPVTMLPRLRSDERKLSTGGWLLAPHHGPRSPWPVDRAGRCCVPAGVDRGPCGDDVTRLAGEVARSLSDVHERPRTGSFRKLADSTSVPGLAVAAVRPRRAGAGRGLCDGGQLAARGRGRPSS